MSSNKKAKGQFYTTNSSYILDGLTLPPPSTTVIEPFAGKGDLLTWLAAAGAAVPVEAYDIEPKAAGIVQRDTLQDPPDYRGKWILTNPPYLARNKSDKKDVYDKYNTNDLYKCFIWSMGTEAAGGIMIIPAGFFFSPRDLDTRCRHQFMTHYRLTHVRYFEETVFSDTATTVVAVAFERSAAAPLAEQRVEWQLYPSKERRIFTMSAAHQWIIGGEIYGLPVAAGIQVRRHVEGHPLKEGEQQTNMTLNALDSGTEGGQICLSYRAGYVYPAKECSRTYATLRVIGKTLTEEEQRGLCADFNAFLDAKRAETWSLFLPQFRESKEYARKRIPFELAYQIVLHLMQRRSSSPSQSSP